VAAVGVLLLGGIAAASGAGIFTLPMAVSALGALGIGGGVAAEIFAAYQKKNGGDASWNESHPESANLPDDSHL
jgi:amino acid transporter